MENEAYSYLLGQYLGDGHINKMNRTYKLRIFNDVKYVKLNDFIFKKLKEAFPKNKINSCFYQNHIITYVYSNKIPKLFPQHGKGLKNSRDVRLLKWQYDLLNYKYLFAGLLHSDGCIYIDRGYKMCIFSNTSNDILNLFTECCDKLNLRYTITKNHVNIRRRKEVSWISENIGDKKIIKLP